MERGQKINSICASQEEVEQAIAEVAATKLLAPFPKHDRREASGVILVAAVIWLSSKEMVD
jgi:hypothetical protein